MTTSMRASHYDVLEVPVGASPTELKAAYRAKVKQLHPDSGGDSEAFDALQVAWSVVGDVERRREYDSWLEDTRPVMGGARIAVQQRFEERELEVERRAWEARREEARRNAATKAEQEARQVAEQERSVTKRRLALEALLLVVLLVVVALSIAQII